MFYVRGALSQALRGIRKPDPCTGTESPSFRGGAVAQTGAQRVQPRGEGRSRAARRPVSWWRPTAA
jgi:hypothetical protein